MRKLRGSAITKTVAFILASIFIMLTVASTVCIICCKDNDAYNYVSSDFEQTGFCKSYIRNRLEFVAEYVYWEDISGLKNEEFLFHEANFSYVIKDGSGKTVVDTRKSNSKTVISGYTLFEVNSKGEHIEEYTADGYIDMPIVPMSASYPYYFMYEHRVDFFGWALCSGVLSLVLFVFLMYSAGVDKDGVIAMRGINKLPFDLLFIIELIIFACVTDDFYYLSINNFANITRVLFSGISAYIVVLLGLAVCFTAAARFKVKGWWKNTIIYKLGLALINFLRWAILAVPDVWKLVLAYCAFTILNLLLFVLMIDVMEGLALIALVVLDTVCLLLVVWFGNQLKALKRAGEEFSKGNYDYKVDTTKFWPGLKQYGNELNGTAEGMTKAIEERLKSERFKTELITNVSHDLKTPLTSIVSYVDLLKKEQIENEKAAEYIDVIDRQSAKLKKLTEDLIEASKASSGAISVNKDNLNIGEFIMQSVGEFSEKLESAEITPVIDVPEDELLIFTDGRLLWRVFDNLIQNIVKYAQPGTRAYFNIEKAARNVRISVKNISKEPLNVSAETLMERFVRGDSSRNSEGNGLGLSIAKSLTELCGGVFSLFLDGDLYKVVLTFPLSENENE